MLPSLETMRNQKPLVALVMIVGAGVGMGAMYLGRLTLKNPDVNWRRRTNPLSNDGYRDRQYKFFNVTKNDYSKSPAPEY